MRSGDNNFNYFSENKLTKIANLIKFKCMLIFCLEDWGWTPCAPLVYATAPIYGEQASVGGRW